MNDPEQSREATYEERAVLGVCPVCMAMAGVKCDPDKGVALGVNIYGKLPNDGVHLARLVNAPKVVRLVRA